MSLLEVIQAKREHAARLSTSAGIAGEAEFIESQATWIPRPRAKAMKNLLAVLSESGIDIKATSFDAISVPKDVPLDLDDPASIKAALPNLTFIEIKQANQDRVKDDFSGFFFALTENEIAAATQLGNQHRVALYNAQTKTYLLTTVGALLARARSTTWQVSLQL